ncbi:MAG: glutaminyl-peptide cyclotransferase [Bacteroidales bacterium]|jgi:glutamine cyclotransferase|nr:glutaminyl-peptide cyclotransferase [Bacteroidales bacterium]MBR0314552.1 glutaminyl-peptide cyclotransferase [Bacteroidales bacterium]
MNRRIPTILLALLLLIPVSALSQDNVVKAKRHKVKVLAEYPHDTKSFTQGLFFYDGYMWETTGQKGESCLNMLDYKTGKWKRKWKFNSRYFIEGSCVVNDRFFILTWEEHTCFVFSLKNPENKLKEIGRASYPTEGWGLTTDGKRLIMSDGSSSLYFRDPGSFYCNSTLKVTLDGKPLPYLNELEWIKGKIWANVYTTDDIVIIDPETGVVTDVIDCKGILPEKLTTKATDVLNGIAFDPSDGSVYVTGKYWPRLYKITY